MKNLKIIQVHSIVLACLMLTQTTMTTPENLNNPTVNQDAVKKIKSAYRKSKQPKVTSFTPDKAFGGAEAQGQYNHRNKTATVIHQGTRYDFTEIVENRNPLGSDNQDGIVEIGSFTKRLEREMPITLHLYGKLNENSQPETDTRQVPGSTSATFAPIQFKPADQFQGDGLVGNYFKSNQIATIHDPSGKNSVNYSFEKVEEGGVEKPVGLTLIGSYYAHNNNNSCTSQACLQRARIAAVRQVNLYGIQTAQ